VQRRHHVDGGRQFLRVGRIRGADRQEPHAVESEPLRQRARRSTSSALVSMP
jgi:hypothetical protein